jgi:hypothetical protein
VTAGASLVPRIRPGSTGLHPTYIPVSGLVSASRRAVPTLPSSSRARAPGASLPYTRSTIRESAWPIAAPMCCGSAPFPRSIVPYARRRSFGLHPGMPILAHARWRSRRTLLHAGKRKPPSVPGAFASAHRLRLSTEYPLGRRGQLRGPPNRGGSDEGGDAAQKCDRHHQRRVQTGHGRQAGDGARACCPGLCLRRPRKPSSARSIN